MPPHLGAILAGTRVTAALQRSRGQVRQQNLQLGRLSGTLELARLQRRLKLQDLGLKSLQLSLRATNVSMSHACHSSGCQMYLLGSKAWYPCAEERSVCLFLPLGDRENGKVDARLLSLAVVLLDQRPPLRGGVLSMFWGRGWGRHGGISRTVTRCFIPVVDQRERSFPTRSTTEP